MTALFIVALLLPPPTDLGVPWTSYRSYEGGYEITLPKNFEYATATIPLGPPIRANVEVRLYLAVTELNGREIVTAFVVSKQPQKVLNLLPPNKSLLEHGLDGLQSNPKINVFQRKTVDHASFGEGIAYRLSVVQANDQSSLYVVSVQRRELTYEFKYSSTDPDRPLTASERKTIYKNFVAGSKYHGTDDFSSDAIEAMSSLFQF